MRKLCVATILACLPLSAQDFRLGLKAGMPLTSALADSYDAAKRPILGATAEVDLPFSLTLSVDGLYNRVTFQVGLETHSVSGPSLFLATKNVANRWEFPSVLKRRLPTGRLHSFAGAGIAFDHVSNGRALGVNCISYLLFPQYDGCHQVNDSPAPDLTRPSRPVGFVLDGGIDIPLSALRLSPEVRFIHWSGSHFDLESRLNQVQFLLTIKCCSR